MHDVVSTILSTAKASYEWFTPEKVDQDTGSRYFHSKHSLNCSFIRPLSIAIEAKWTSVVMLDKNSSKILSSQSINIVEGSPFGR